MSIRLLAHPPEALPSGRHQAFVLAISLLFALSALVHLQSIWHTAVQPGAMAPTAPTTPDWGRPPLSFVPNVGHTDPSVQFQAHSRSGTLFFTQQEVVLALPEYGNTDRSPAQGTRSSVPHATVVRIQFDGVNPAATITGGDTLPGHVNYLHGNDPVQWRTNVPTYAGVVYHDLYPGIDLRYDGTTGHLKGTYLIAPGTNPARIRWRYRGVQNVEIDRATGDLRIAVAAGQTLTEHAPIAWQEIRGQRMLVPVSYAVAADNSMSFALGAYDTAHPLTIDPLIEWSTYLGGSDEDMLSAVAVDAAGHVYVTGNSFSADFPTAHAFQPTNPGNGSACSRSVPGPCQDVVITKFSADGRTLVYSTYLGGVAIDVGTAIAVDGAGNAYIAGITASTDFPTQQQWQAQCALNTARECQDGFVAKLDPRGAALSYSTYLGGTDFDNPEGIAVDRTGAVVVAGATASANFPLRTPLPGMPGGTNAFITKFTAGGNGLIFSTLVGGSGGDSGLDVAMDAAGQIYVTGVTGSTNFPTLNAMQQRCAVDAQGVCTDAFVTKLQANGSALVYSAYLGGSGIDVARGLAVDNAGQAVVTGATASSNFPLRSALQKDKRGLIDAFVTKLTRTGTALVYSTYLGGTDFEEANAVALDPVGNVYLAGVTTSADFPTVNAVQTTPGGGDCTDGSEPVACPDAFVTMLAADGATLGYSTYVGGAARPELGELGFAEAAQDIVVDGLGNAYIVGATTALDFPTRTALQPQCAVAADGTCQDGFVLKIGNRTGTPRVYLPLISR